MYSNSRTILLIAALALTLAACNEQATVPIAQGYGPDPTLPPPKNSWIPTVNIATAKG